MTATFDKVRAERDELRKLMLGKLDAREQAMLELKAAKEAHATDLARCAALEKELGEVKEQATQFAAEHKANLEKELVIRKKMTENIKTLHNSLNAHLEAVEQAQALKAGISPEAGVQTEQLSWISLAPLTADEQVPESDDPFSAGWITSECARRALERELKVNFLLSRKLELAESLLLKDQQAKCTRLLAKDAPLQRRLLADC